MDRIQTFAQSVSDYEDPEESADELTEAVVNKNEPTKRQRRSRRRKPVDWHSAAKLSECLERIPVGFDPIPNKDCKRSSHVPRIAFERYVTTVLELKLDEELYRRPALYSEEWALVDEGLQIDGVELITLYLDNKYPYPTLLHEDIRRRYHQLDLVHRILCSDGDVLADAYEFSTKFSQGPHLSCVDIALYSVIPHDHKKWGKYIYTLDELIYGST